MWSVNNVQLGVLLSATPGSEAYVALGDGFTAAPDGTIVTMAKTKIWYVNNDCTGAAYAMETFGWEPIAQFAYVGFQNQIYTAAAARAFSTPITVQSFSTGEATCTAQSITYYAHAATVVGAGDPINTMPWHVVFP